MRTFSTDYLGRRVDLLIFQQLARTGDKLLQLSLGTAGEVVSGVEKVAQTFTILLLTDPGSVLYQPQLGTNLVPSVRGGQLRNEADVRTAFLLAAALVQRAMNLAGLKAGLPPDEMLASYALTKVVIDRAGGTLSLTVQLTTAAGEGTTVLLPVPLPIQ